MTSKTHVRFAILGSITICSIAHLPLEPVIFSSVVGALIPDCDNSQSSGTSIFGRVPFTKHRGIMHSLWICLLISITGIFLKGNWIGFAVGYTSHIILDLIADKTKIKTRGSLEAVIQKVFSILIIIFTLIILTC